MPGSAPHPVPISSAGSSPRMAILDPDPDVLAARDLIAEARAIVARSNDLIARGRKLREEAEKVLERFRKREPSLRRTTA